MCKATLLGKSYAHRTRGRKQILNPIRAQSVLVVAHSLIDDVLVEGVTVFGAAQCRFYSFEDENKSWEMRSAKPNIQRSMTQLTY